MILKVFLRLFLSCEGLQGLLARAEVPVAAGRDVLHSTAQGEGPGSTGVARSARLCGPELRRIHAPRRLFEAFRSTFSTFFHHVLSVFQAFSSCSEGGRQRRTLHPLAALALHDEPAWGDGARRD